MMRVARRAVLLIEPNDQTLPDRFATTLSRLGKNVIKKILRRPTDYHAFEQAGNYVYSISRREMEKFALGLGFSTVAFRGVNDYYLPGVEFEPAVRESALFRRVSRKIARYDFLCRIGVSQPALLAAMLFKQSPSDAVRRSLRLSGYDVVDLPLNPYFSAAQTPDN